MRESPHGKSSVRRELEQRLGFCSLSSPPPPPPPSPGVLPVGNRVLGWAQPAEEQRGDPAGSDKTGSAGRGHRRAKWGAQVTLPASSRSLQPSADTQPQAGGGVRGRDGKGRLRQGCCCRRPQGPALAGRGAGSGTRRARVGRSALAGPRPMARGSHRGRRRVRTRAQRRSGWRAGRHSASLSLTLAHPHQRSPAEPARLRRPEVLGLILETDQSRVPNCQTG